MYTVKLTTGETLICSDVWQDFNEFRLSVVDKDGDYDLCCSIEEVESIVPDEESLAKTKEESLGNKVCPKDCIGDCRECELVEKKLQALKILIKWYQPDIIHDLCCFGASDEEIDLVKEVLL